MAKEVCGKDMGMNVKMRLEMSFGLGWYGIWRRDLHPNSQVKS
jgi:hypothetical protein